LFLENKNAVICRGVGSLAARYPDLRQVTSATFPSHMPPASMTTQSVGERQRDD
jgi:hypothetical protein